MRNIIFYIFHVKVKTQLRYLRIYFPRTIEGTVNVFKRRDVTIVGKVNNGRDWLHCFV